MEIQKALFQKELDQIQKNDFKFKNYSKGFHNLEKMINLESIQTTSKCPELEDFEVM